MGKLFTLDHIIADPQKPQLVSASWLDEADAYFEQQQAMYAEQARLEDQADAALQNLLDLAETLTAHPEQKDLILQIVNSKHELEGVLDCPDCSQMSVQGLVAGIHAVVSQRLQSEIDGLLRTLTNDGAADPSAPPAPEPPGPAEPAIELPPDEPLPEPVIVVEVPETAPAAAPAQPAIQLPPPDPGATPNISQEMVWIVPSASSKAPVMLRNLALALLLPGIANYIRLFKMLTYRLRSVVSGLKWKINDGRITDNEFRSKHASFGVLPKPKMEKFLGSLTSVGDQLDKQVAQLVNGNEFKFDANAYKARFADFDININAEGRSLHRLGELEYSSAPFGVLGYTRADFVKYADLLFKAMEHSDRMGRRIIRMQFALRRKLKEAKSENQHAPPGGAKIDYRALKRNVRFFKSIIFMYMNTVRLTTLHFVGILKKAT